MSRFLNITVFFYIVVYIVGMLSFVNILPWPVYLVFQGLAIVVIVLTYGFDRQFAIFQAALLFLTSMSGIVNMEGVRDFREDLVTSFFGVGLVPIMLIPFFFLSLTKSYSIKYIFIFGVIAVVSLVSYLHGYYFHEIKKGASFILIFFAALYILNSIPPLRVEALSRYVSTMLMVGVAIIFLSFLGYGYFDIKYPYGPHEYAILPLGVYALIFLSFVNSPNSRFLLFILLSLIVFGKVGGILQTSSRDVIIILLALLAVGAHKIKIFWALFVLGLGALIVAKIDVSGNFLYKVTVFSHLLDPAQLLNDAELLRLSVGNMLAEFYTLLGVLSERYFIPLGFGVSLPDFYGLLSYANSGAYHAVSSEFSYPMHSGLAYLLIWFGALFVTLANRKLLVTGIVFLLYGMSFKHLLAISIVIDYLRINYKKENP